MFPIIFAGFMVGTLTIITVSAIKEEVEANLLHRIFATYLKRFKRRKKMA